MAVAAARRLVEHAGGPAVWRARTIEVQERGYLASGEVVELRIWRDLSRGARRLEQVSPTRRTVEWLAPEGGWVSRNGVVTPLPREELMIELQGLRQEP